jgi:hypothetical protein
MGISEFSYELLEVIYKDRSNHPSSIKLAENLKKTKEEINESLEYLEDKKFIRLGTQTLDGNYHSISLTSKGIDQIEEDLDDEDDFFSDDEKDIGETDTDESKQYDFFISHASEDKKDFVEKLARKLKENGLEVWYDSYKVEWGDELRPTIDNGLKNCKWGIVVFSPNFLKLKKWTEYELNSLFSREEKGRKFILPIWHNITRKELEDYSPAFADRFALPSTDLNKIVEECLKKLNKKSQKLSEIDVNSSKDLDSVSKDNKKEYKRFVEIYDSLTSHDILTSPRFNEKSAKNFAELFCKEENYPKFKDFIDIIDDLTYHDILTSSRFSLRDAIKIALERLHIKFDIFPYSPDTHISFI